MQKLIKIEIKDGKQLVSARELHKGLQIGRDFSTWFKAMCEYGFEQDIDFTPILGESNGGRPKIEYAITLDMAKEISMIQRNELGKKFRQYFIECEKQLLNQVPVLSQKDIAILQVMNAKTEGDMLIAMKHFEHVVSKPLVDKIEYQQPLVELAKKRLDKNGLISITDATKTFNAKKGKITKWAKDNGYLHKTLNEVNIKGNDFFRVYDNGGYKCVGITEEGIQLINKNLDKINSL